MINQNGAGRESAQRSGVKPGALIMSLAVLVLLIAAIVFGISYQRSRTRYLASRASEETLRGQFNAAIESIAEIQQGLNDIIPAEERLVRLSQSAEMGSKIEASQKEQIFASIAELRESIDASKQRIRRLEEDLANSQAEATGLHRIVDNLKRAISEKEAMIARLAARVDELTVTVDGLRADVARGEERIAKQQVMIEEKSRELGEIFYVIGTKDQLKAKDIITETGGILGLRKTVQLTGNFNRSDFTKLDTDRFDEIPINGSEPLVLSTQARSSYELHISGERAILQIADVGEFRKVKYLVVMVKAVAAPRLTF